MPVTLKDIALAAGVTHPTVSRALRNHRSISRATCERIQALAREMGYRPDPALSALAARRVKMRMPYHYGFIAVLCHRSESEGIPHYIQDKIRGMRRRALQSGCDLEIFKVPSQPAGQRALARVLFHRGIRGVIICPMPWETNGFDLTAFTPVGLGENALPLGIHYVSYDHDHAIQETYSALRNRGYRNIGFCNSRESEARNRHLFSASWMKCRQLDGARPIGPLLVTEEGAGLPAWIRRNRFDAVITNRGESVEELRRAGFRIPDELGVAGFGLPVTGCRHPEFAAYRVKGERMGILAVDFLQLLMRREDLDQSPEVYSMVLRGTWREGSSVRSAS